MSRASVTLWGAGINDNVAAQVDRSHQAIRTSLRPPEKGVFGSFSLYCATGTVAAGMASALPIFQVRWASAAANLLLRRLVLTAGNTATAFTAGLAAFDLRRLSGFTVADATNGTQVSLTSGKAQAKSSRFAASQLSSTGSIYALNTSASGLTGGTKTPDTNALAGLQVSIPATAGAQIIPAPGITLWDANDGGKEPLELQINEGFEVRCVAIPGTGTWAAGFLMEWDEIDPARYFQS
jgi:hypothetical protein